MARYILVVDPIGKTRLELLNMLKKYNIEILHAKDEDEASTKISTLTESIKLVVWSVYTEVGNEFETIKEFKSKPLNIHVPLMIISVFNEKRFIFRAIDAGAVDYIVRPFSEQLVVKKISGIVGLSVVDKESVEYNSDEEEEDKIILSLKEMLSIQIKSAMRAKYPLSVMLIALMNATDQNELNQREIVSIIMKTIKQKIRETDLIVKYGIDNIIVILPFTDDAGAEIVENKIRSQLISNSFLNQKAKGYVLGSSFVSFPQDGKTREQLLAKLQAKLKTSLVFTDQVF